MLLEYPEDSPHGHPTLARALLARYLPFQIQLKVVPIWYCLIELKAAIAEQEGCQRARLESALLPASWGPQVSSGSF
jgi:hypothetical protein